MDRLSSPFQSQSLAQEQTGGARRSSDRTRRGPGSAPFYRSIRFRLTAWYAIGLMVILIALGLTMRTLLEQAMEQDTGRRLEAAMLEVQSHVEISADQTLPQQDAQGNQIGGSVSLVPDVSALDAILVSGLSIAVVNEENEQVFSSGIFQDVALASLDPTEYLQPGSDRIGTIELEGTQLQVMTSPIESPAGVPGATTGSVGAILVMESLDSQERTLNLLNQILQIAGIAGIGLASWGGWILAGRVLAPVNKITRTTSEIAQQDSEIASFSRRLEVPRTADEISELTVTFNELLDRVESSFGAQQRFVADASHELRTPLTAMRGNVDVLLRQLQAQRELSPELLEESLSDVRDESARMGRLISDLLTLARTDTSSARRGMTMEEVDLRELAQQALTTSQALVQGQRLEFEGDEETLVRGEADRLVQVMIILLDNAIRHTPEGGLIKLRVDTPDSTDGPQGVDDEFASAQDYYGLEEMTRAARIMVMDSGEGISPEAMPHLFERFYRVENSRDRDTGGTGLGLSIALAIVRSHGGWIDVESAVDRGTIFSVWIPVLEENLPAWNTAD